MKNTSNKKIFNSLDLLITAAFILLFVFLAVKGISEMSVGTKVLEVSFTAEKVENGILKDVKAGDTLYGENGEIIGIVTDFKVAEATEIFTDTRLENSDTFPLVEKPLPGYSRLTVTVEVEAISEDRGYSVNGINLKVNKEMKVHLGGFSAHGYFSSIAEVEGK